MCFTTKTTEGGHGGAANNRQLAYMSALAYTFCCGNCDKGNSDRAGTRDRRVRGVQVPRCLSEQTERLAVGAVCTHFLCCFTYMARRISDDKLS